MKILMVTPYLPYPPLSGGQTRSFNLLKHLSKNCDITLFSFVLPDQSSRYIKNLKRYCSKVRAVERGKTWSLKKILFTGLSPYPFLVINYFSRQLKRMIGQELRREDYDLVHVECFYLMPNIPRTTTPILLVDQTIEFAVYQHYVETLPRKFSLLKPLLSIDVFKIKFWETRFWHRADCLVAVSQEDQRLMRSLSRREVAVVPNGVDEALLKIKKVEKYRQPTILYGVANFKWMQNKEGAVNLLKYVWPQIKAQVPQARLLIIGRHSESFIRSTGLVAPGEKDIVVKEVRDAERVYRRSWLMVAPMGSGGGSRTKFFEAMACGLPIVTTPEGIEGIDAQWGKDVFVNKNFEQLARTAVKLLTDQKFRTKAGQLARRLIKEKYSWRLSAQKLYSIYQQVAKEQLVK